MFFILMTAKSGKLKLPNGQQNLEYELYKINDMILSVINVCVCVHACTYMWVIAEAGRGQQIAWMELQTVVSSPDVGARN